MNSFLDQKTVVSIMNIQINSYSLDSYYFENGRNEMSTISNQTLNPINDDLCQKERRILQVDIKKINRVIFSIYVINH